MARDDKQAQREQEPRRSVASGEAGGEGKRESGEDQVDKRFEEAAEKGHFGYQVDPEPNESYTVKGVTKDAG